jgi:hypothetical protein
MKSKDTGENSAFLIRIVPIVLFYSLAIILALTRNSTETTTMKGSPIFSGINLKNACTGHDMKRSKQIK